jgi:hypothetical protein
MKTIKKALIVFSIFSIFLSSTATAHDVEVKFNRRPLVKQVHPSPPIPAAKTDIAEIALAPERILLFITAARYSLLLEDRDEAVIHLQNAIDVIDRVKINSTVKQHVNNKVKNRLEAISALYEMDDKKYNLIIPVNGILNNINISTREKFNNPSHIPELTNVEHVLINISFENEVVKKDLEKLILLIRSGSYDEAATEFKRLQDRDIGYFFSSDLPYAKTRNNLKLARLLLQKGYVQETRHALKHVEENIYNYEKEHPRRTGELKEAEAIRANIQVISDKLLYDPSDYNYQLDALKQFDDWYKTIRKWYKQ